MPLSAHCYPLSLSLEMRGGSRSFCNQKGEPKTSEWERNGEKCLCLFQMRKGWSAYYLFSPSTIPGLHSRWNPPAAGSEAKWFWYPIGVVSNLVIQFAYPSLIICSPSLSFSVIRCKTFTCTLSTVHTLLLLLLLFRIIKFAIFFEGRVTI